MNRIVRYVMLALTSAFMVFLMGCGNTESGPVIADTSEMKAILDEGTSPVFADALLDGEYAIEAVSSTSLFQVKDATIAVADSQMVATFVIKGAEFDKLYLAEAKDAGEANEIEVTVSTDESGAQILTVQIPVEALNQEIALSVLDAEKNTLYDRRIAFLASSLSADAFGGDYMTAVSELGLSDGMYLVDVVMEGGSGRASIESPAVIEISGDTCTARIVWSSDKYDYMLVDGEKYLTANDELGISGNSIFVIPVIGFDYPMPVVGDTTAMSTPHEISYTFYFDSKTVQPNE